MNNPAFIKLRAYATNSGKFTVGNVVGSGRDVQIEVRPNGDIGCTLLLSPDQIGIWLSGFVTGSRS